MPRKRNNRLVRPGSWVARTTLAVKSLLLTVVIKWAVDDVISAFLRWFFDRWL